MRVKRCFCVRGTHDLEKMQQVLGAVGSSHMQIVDSVVEDLWQWGCTVHDMIMVH